MSATPHSQDSLSLDNCAKEPIHIPGKIQGHGFLIVCDPSTLTITHCSENLSKFTEKTPAALLGQPLSTLHPELPAVLPSSPTIHDWIGPLPQTLRFKGGVFYANAHQYQQRLLIDFESAAVTGTSIEAADLISQCIHSMQLSPNLGTLSQQLCERFKAMLGFDRVMTYRFDEEWNGQVIAESRNPELEPYLGLHYPASDIPAQARKLFEKNIARSIKDIDTPPSRILSLPNSPASELPVDLSFSQLRSSSPIHLEYLKNMGVQATFSLSIVHEQKLWGLFAMHHYQPKLLPYPIRKALISVAKSFSGFLFGKTEQQDEHYVAQLRQVNQALIQQLTHATSLDEALLTQEYTLLDLNRAEGTALIRNNRIHTLGNTPDDTFIHELVDWLQETQQDDLYATHTLSAHFPAAEPWAQYASGLLAISLSRKTKEYILWFMPEVIQNVYWAGDPNKPVLMKAGRLQLSPRKSFETWTQQVKNKALPWHTEELNTADTLRQQLIYHILQKNTQQISSLNQQLLSLNRELMAFSYTVSHDLAIPLRAISGYVDLALETPESDEASHLLAKAQVQIDNMEMLITDLLTYAQASQRELRLEPVALGSLIQEAIELIQNTYPQIHFHVQIEEIPDVYGDRSMLRQLVQNLLSNAFKYSQQETSPSIHIGVEEANGQTAFFIQDNGIGISTEEVNQLFDLFYRSPEAEAFSGSGMGLPIVKRILEKHQGSYWIQTSVGQGTRFYFTLPDQHSYQA